MTDKLRQSKLLKLHMTAMDYLLESEQFSEQAKDEELTFSRAFFMGIVGGIYM